MGKEERLFGQDILEFRNLWGRTSQRRCWAGPQAWVPVLGPLFSCWHSYCLKWGRGEVTSSWCCNPRATSDFTYIVILIGIFISNHGLPWCLGVKKKTENNSSASAEDTVSITGSGRCPGKGNGNTLQYSCLENLMDRGAWWVIAHGVAWVGQHLATKPPNCPHGDILHRGLDGYSLSRSR